MAQTKSTSKSKATLERELADLRMEVETLREQSEHGGDRRRHHFSWKVFASWVCLILASALLIAGSLLIWTGRTIVDTDRYVDTVGPLIEQPEIQTAVASYTTTRLFENRDVEAHVREVLPPRADFLAPQLTGQLRSQTENTLKKLLANPEVQARWTQSLERSHEALIKFSKEYEGEGEIKVSDIFSVLGERLKDTRLSFLSDKQLPDKVGSVTVATAGWLPALRNLASNIGIYQFLVTFLFVIFSVLAVMLSRDRRRGIIRLTRFFAVAMLLMLLAIRIGGSSVASAAQPEYQSAVQVAYDTITSSLRTQTITIFMMSILLGLIIWLSGRSRSAEALKSRADHLFNGRLHETIFGNGENSLTLWVRDHKRALQWGYILFIAVIMVLVRLSPGLIITYGILMLLGIIIIEVLAASETKRGGRR